MVDQVHTSSKLTIRAGAMIFIDEGRVTIALDTPSDLIRPGEIVLTHEAIRAINAVFPSTVIPVGSTHDINLWVFEQNGGDLRLQWFRPRYIPEVTE